MGCCCSSSTYLTTKGTEAEGVQQAALTRLAGIGNSFGRPGLRPFIQKHHARAVDDVSLDACDIQHLLNLRDSDHIVVRRTSNLQHAATDTKILVRKHIERSINRTAFSRRPEVSGAAGEREREREREREISVFPHLHNMVVLVLRQAKGANAAGGSAFQTEEIAFAFVRDSVNPTRGKERRRQQWLQPPRLLSLWMILAVVSFDPYRTSLSIANTIVNSQHLILELLMRKYEETNAPAALTQAL